MTTTFVFHLFGFFFIAFIALTLPVAYAVLSGLLAMWFSFSSASLGLRIVAFLVGVWLLGLTGGAMVAKPVASLGALCVLGMLIVVWDNSRGNPVWLWVLCLAWIGYLFFAVDRQVATSLWSFRLVAISLGGAVPFAALRLLGFRFTRVTGAALTKTTGRSLDEWFEKLDRANASESNYAEIMANLRGFGLCYEDQRVVVVAYLQAHGRPTISLSPDGMRMQSMASPALTDAWSGVTLEKFTIRNLFVVTLAVACLARLTAYLQWSFPTRREWMVGGLCSLVFSAILAWLAIVLLGIRTRRNRLFWGLGIAWVPVLLLPLLLGGDPRLDLMTEPGILYYGSVYFALYLVAAFGLLLSVLRRLGYRLVRPVSCG